MIALVTGASGGIGRATALRLASQGLDIAVHYRSRLEDAMETEQAVRALGRRACLVQGDLTEASEAEAVVQDTMTALGPISVLVNNAGITRDQLSIRMKDEAFIAVLDANLVASFRLARLVLPSMMRARYGRLVFVSSVAGLYGNVGQTNYSASKAGLIGLTKSLAKEVGRRGITVNAVAPGLIDTDMTSALDASYREAIQDRIALGRMGRADEAAAAIAFLASSDASYITGAVLEVSGGIAL